MIETRLSTNAYGNANVEVILLVILEEQFELFNAIESSETVEEKRCVIGRSFVLLMNALQVISQILSVTRIEEAANDIRRLEISNSFDVLLNCTCNKAFFVIP